ncbi:Ldh family oxidoreductase [Salinibacillus xinjiangensis]|uniref:Ldh family oxidoreductase n=1 Tax=Salinibacillus xinjiangensis TaxID=1229268 RepID=A0A6G1X1V7_9BACI|nr:Ldh family oxidoreductase [Salinibacillus xinjiangensis]MRG84922.1 Ldh family oxidoreductase [Salinibacillus xinjiangensis]
MKEAKISFRAESLESFATAIFQKVGLTNKDAQLIARHLVLANLRGVDSHGLSKVDIYVKRFQEKIVNRKPTIQRMRESPVSALIDADNGPGIVAATDGIKLAVEKAKETGVGIVGITHSNHCGMLADYVQYAVQHECIALATTNAPAVMAPWGGKGRFFGTNPIAYGIPTGKEKDIIFDMATSTVAKGKIILAKLNGEKIPLGWAISKEGKPTSDPNEAIEGLILPMGGPKGYGLTFLVETLSALFTGAAYGPHISDLFTDFQNKQNVGHFFFVTRADLFQDINKFKERMDEMIQEMKQIPLTDEVEQIFLPGEIELHTYEKRKHTGIPLSIPLIDELSSIANQLNISNPLESSKP